MAGKKGKTAQAHQGAQVQPHRHHYCPTCPEDDQGNLAPMKPVRVMPANRMMFSCKAGHRASKRETILR